MLTFPRYPICFYARRFAEETLIKVVYAFEQNHDRGTYKLYKELQMELEQVVKDRLSAMRPCDI